MTEEQKKEIYLFKIAYEKLVNGKRIRFSKLKKCSNKVKRDYVKITDWNSKTESKWIEINKHGDSIIIDSGVIDYLYKIFQILKKRDLRKRANIIFKDLIVNETKKKEGLK